MPPDAKSQTWLTFELRMLHPSMARRTGGALRDHEHGRAEVRRGDVGGQVAQQLRGHGAVVADRKRRAGAQRQVQRLAARTAADAHRDAEAELR